MVLKWFRRRQEPEALTPEQERKREERRAGEERRVLDELHRQTDALLAEYRELARRHRPEKMADLPEVPPRFTSVEEGRAYMDRLAAWIRE
ncbi:hypothetical protein DFP74_6421 [Nocardiopsis sp. Huas11]|nr:hypothetical protein DFP74_6421 [Nocardiopsis sp. Huas11]